MQKMNLQKEHWLKSKAAIIVTLFFIIMFASCDTMGSTAPLSDPPYLMLSNGGKTALNVQYVRTNYFDTGHQHSITIISSTRELEQYFERNRNQIYDSSGAVMPDRDFLNAIEKYSASFFAENFLLIVRLVEPSGSNRHRVERIDENGDIVIRRLVPEVGTADMAAWSIIIELDNAFKNRRYQVVLS